MITNEHVSACVTNMKCSGACRCHESIHAHEMRAIGRDSCTRARSFTYSHKIPLVKIFAISTDVYLGGLIEHFYFQSITINQSMPNTKT